MTAQEIQAGVDARTWFHRIKLPHGIVTPGSRDPSEAWKLYQLPSSLDGKSVLDIGAWDGGFSFEAESRGSQSVVAADVWGRNETGSSGVGGSNILFVIDAIGSRVDPENWSVYELDPKKIRADLVLFLEVLYHLEHPILALRFIRSILKPDGLCCLETWIDAEWISEPAMIFYPGAELNGDHTNWWGPNIKCVQSMAVAAGFKSADLVWSKQDVHFGGRGKRACFHLR